MDNNMRSTPVTPLPNPGEGGPVYDESTDNSAATPVIPLPNPGEGGPVYEGSSGSSNNGAAIPVIPLPNPGEGGPVNSGTGGGIVIPIRPRYARVRFLNAAFGYQPFRVLINNTRVVSWLNYGAVSSYRRVTSGYQTVTVTGTDGYIYLQKTLPFQAGSGSTIAIINTASGLDLLQIPDSCCAPVQGKSNFRVSNLARNTGAMDVLLADGRTVFGDVRFKETTAFKSIQPGAYEFLFAETDQTPMPTWLDIETLDSAFIGMYPLPNMVASLYLNVRPNLNYTAYLISSGMDHNAVQVMVTAD